MACPSPWLGPGLRSGFSGLHFVPVLHFISHLLVPRNPYNPSRSFAFRRTFVIDKEITLRRSTLLIGKNPVKNHKAP